MQNAGYLETLTESSSAALNWRGIALSTRFKARRVARSGVNPKALREQAPGIHVEYHPAWRIMVSKTAARISSTCIQCWPTGWRSGSTPSGRTHSLRRKTECGFTLARFLQRWAPGGGSNSSITWSWPGTWSRPGPACRLRPAMNVPRRNRLQNQMHLHCLRPPQSLRSRAWRNLTHLNRLRARQNAFSLASGGTEGA